MVDMLFCYNVAYVAREHSRIFRVMENVFGDGEIQ